MNWVQFNFKFLFPCTFIFFFCLNLSLIFQFQVFVLESNSYTKQLHRFSELKRFSTRWDFFFVFVMKLAEPLWYLTSYFSCGFSASKRIVELLLFCIWCYYDSILKIWSVYQICHAVIWNFNDFCELCFLETWGSMFSECWFGFGISWKHRDIKILLFFFLELLSLNPDGI